MGKFYRLIDEDGVVVNEIREGDSVKITRKESIEYLTNTVPWGEGWSFVKLFDDSLTKLALRLSGAELATAFILSKYIKYESGLLCNHNSKHPLSNADIQKIMSYSDRTITNVMDTLVKKKVLFRGKTGKQWQYYANPHIFCRGQRINKTLQDMFRDYPQYKDEEFES